MQSGWEQGACRLQAGRGKGGASIIFVTRFSCQITQASRGLSTLVAGGYGAGMSHGWCGCLVRVRILPVTPKKTLVKIRKSPKGSDGDEGLSAPSVRSHGNDALRPRRGVAGSASYRPAGTQERSWRAPRRGSPRDGRSGAGCGGDVLGCCRCTHQRQGTGADRSSPGACPASVDGSRICHFPLHHVILPPRPTGASDKSGRLAGPDHDLRRASWPGELPRFRVHPLCLACIPSSKRTR